MRVGDRAKQRSLLQVESLRSKPKLPLSGCGIGKLVLGWHLAELGGDGKEGLGPCSFFFFFFFSWGPVQKSDPVAIEIAWR